MGHFLVTFQRQLACGVLSNSTTLVTGGILNVVFFVFVFVKTVQAQRLAARGQLHHKNAMVRAAHAAPPRCRWLHGLPQWALWHMLQHGR